MTKTTNKKTTKKKPVKKTVTKKAPVKKKQEKKTKSKYNWALMKQEFMTSEHLNPTVFLRSEYGLDYEKNGEARRNTKGWADEKKAFIQAVYEQTLEEIADKEVKRNSEVLTKLMELMRERIETKTEAKQLTVKDLERLWGIFMTMNNRPTRYIKTDNTTVEVPASGLTDEEKASLKKKLEANGLI